MLDDRQYMREPQRQYWSMTTILLISLVVCYVIQSIMNLELGRYKVDFLFGLSVEGLKAGRYYQLITFQFMHANLMHIAFNMIGLYSFGRMIEETLGPRQMLWLYLLSGTIGGLMQVILGLIFPIIGNSTVVGASAGIFGLLAAFCVQQPNTPITMLIYFVLPVTILPKWILVFEAAITVIGLFMQGETAHGAHLGGMLTGVVFIKWNSWFGGARWLPQSRQRPVRPPVRALIVKTSRRPRKVVEELPPAEFISREVDPILEKISAQGIHSLTDRERQILESARSKMARR